MTASLSTRPIRDGAGNSFLQRVLDASGAGTGPYLPVLAIAGPEDAAPIDLAALFDMLGSAIADAGDRIEAAVEAIPAGPAPFAALGHQTVTVTSTAATLATLLGAAIPAGTRTVILQPRADGIRYAHGGATPTFAADVTGIGTDIFEGQQLGLTMADFASLKLVAAVDTLLSLEFRG